MRVDFANVTSVGNQVVEWYWTRDSEIYICIEIHTWTRNSMPTCASTSASVGLTKTKAMKAPMVAFSSSVMPRLAFPTLTPSTLKGVAMLPVFGR